jgi:hypothetical protein
MSSVVQMSGALRRFGNVTAVAAALAARGYLGGRRRDLAP